MYITVADTHKKLYMCIFSALKLDMYDKMKHILFRGVYSGYTIIIANNADNADNADV